MGDAVASNFFMLGYAFQRGLIPVSSEAVDAAIELNDVAVEFNQRAFRWGRRAAIDELAVRRASGLAAEHWQPLSGLDEIVEHRYGQLCDYQNAGYAQSYRNAITQLADSERAVVGGQTLSLSIAAARTLYHVMAYKDEYEVARLFTNGEFMR